MNGTSTVLHYLGVSTCSILADMFGLPHFFSVAFPWVRLASWAGVPGLERFTHIKAWLERIEAR
jgi:glutathione S-transferase